MSTATSPRLITTEELLAMPDDGIERWIINGELREARGGGEAVTVRSSLHSFVMAEIVRVLGNWRRTQPLPRGKVYCGEAGIKLQWNPDVTVGADVAYASAELLAKQSGSTTLIEGVPELLVEICRPTTPSNKSTRRSMLTWMPASRSSGSSIPAAARR